MITRSLQNKIKSRLLKDKALLLFGGRQCGRSTLVEALLSDEDYLYMNGDDADVREAITNASSAKLKAIIGTKKIVFIDQAHLIQNIGLTIKLFTDHLKDVQIIAAGSSAFELPSQVNERLADYKYEYTLYPLSFDEMVKHHGLLVEKQLIEHRMIFGYYPGVVTRQGEEKKHLKILAGTCLYKDLLMLEQIKKPLLFEKLLKALALQVGSEISSHKIAQTVGTDNKTVERYIDLLEKAFVVFRLPALYRNVRNEIKKGKKVYFYDCGIRNTIINNFNPLGSRADTGALWENFVIAERMKFLRYTDRDTKPYFWRTTQQQKIDLIEETDDQLSVYKLKWNKKERVRFPQTFTSNYPRSKALVITPENIEHFLLSDE